MTCTRPTAWFTAASLLLAPALALGADREHQQLAADIRMLQEQTSRLELMMASVDAARHWVDSLYAHGGTRIGPALAHAATSVWSDSGHARRIVLLTDGAVGHESEFLRRVVNDLSDVRLHVLGIGQAPNRWFVREMARAGRGLCDFVHADGEAGPGMRRFLERVERPALTDLELHGLEAGPRRLPDLHLGEPAVLTFRLPEDGADRLTLTARADHHADHPRYRPQGPKIHFDLVAYDILFWTPDRLGAFRSELEKRIRRRLLMLEDAG